MDAIGARGWCKKCKFGEIKGKDVFCTSENSGFKGTLVNAILCSPCFVPSKKKENVPVQPVGFQD